jgi:BirA family biotin operon repressor/biotin-[acetyl-CoA-carboxylase] ligase
MLRTRRLGQLYQLLAVCDSTNGEAARQARARETAKASPSDEGLVIVADSQSAGRGRMGHTWHSPPGTNLHMSLLLRPRLRPDQIPPLTLLVGASVAAVLSQGGAEPRLKWPNDVLLPGPAGGPAGLKKAGGILVEMQSDGEHVRHVVVGIGLNVNTMQFPEPLGAEATSLRLSTGHAWDRGAVLARILNVLEPAWNHFVAHGPSEVIEAWRTFGVLGQQVSTQDAQGVAVDVDSTGALLVRNETGVHRVLSGLA